MSVCCKILTYGAFGLGAYALGAGLAYVFSGAYQPENTRYGSRFHAWMHRINGCKGQLGHVRAVCMGDELYGPNHVKVIGIVCEQCGFVDATHVLSKESSVDDEVCGRSTTGFTWTTRENLRHCSKQ